MILHLYSSNENLLFISYVVLQNIQFILNPKNITIPKGMSFKIEFFRTMTRTIPIQNEWFRWENDSKVNLNRVERKAT